MHSNYSNLSNSSSSSHNILCTKNQQNQQRHKGNCCCQTCINKYKYLASSAGKSLLGCKKSNSSCETRGSVTLLNSGKNRKRKMLSVDALAENLAKKKLKLKEEEDKLNDDNYKLLDQTIELNNRKTIDNEIKDFQKDNKKRLLIKKNKKVEDRKNCVAPLDLTTYKINNTSDTIENELNNNKVNNNNKKKKQNSEQIFENTSEQKNDFQSSTNSPTYSFSTIFPNNILSSTVFDNSSIINAVATLAAAFAAKNTDLKR